MMKRFQSAACWHALATSLLLAALFMPAGNVCFAQALPAAEAAPISTGFALPTTLGSLQYAISASQSLVWGYYGNSGTASSTNFTGDLAYLSNGKRHPFSMIFSGGHSFSESGQGSYSFLNLGFSQVANIGRWNLILSDSVSYLPGTAASGLSGVPGVGDLGVNPVQVGGDTGQGVLTNFSNRVSNDVAGSVQRQITGKTSVTASGSYSTTWFLDSLISSGASSSAGLDSSAATGGGGISHQVDARSSFGGNYAYSDYSYTGNNLGVSTLGFVSQTASAFYSRQFTRKLNLSVSAGPQWTTLNSVGVGSALSLFADVAATYAGKSSSASLIFTRGTNNGYGATGGAVSNSAVFVASRPFAVVWQCSATSSYTRSSNLPVAGIPLFTIDTVVEGVQVSRAIARSLSGYASYTLEHQSSPVGPTVDVFTGLSQVVGFGLTYSPSALHLGRQ
jgi:hypothetical protein